MYIHIIASIHKVFTDKIVLSFLYFLFLNISIMGQEFSIMTYNVENLFDTRHDSLKEDMDYLPDSPLRWTNHRFYEKIHHVMQVIVGVGKWEAPLLVGLCEIENDFVLKAMVAYEPYKQLKYDYIHFESPDVRGIDVALLYRKDLFTPIVSRPIPVKLPNGHSGRDILYVYGTLNNGTTLHIIQVHFPSRREGAVLSEPNRVAAAQIVRHSIDSIFAADPAAGIIIMGDFNDNPSDYVPTHTLEALPYTSSYYTDNRMYNLCHNGKPYEDRKKGSYFHDGRWDLLDQIIVSGSLLNNSLQVLIHPKAHIYSPEWLTKWNEHTHQKVPKRTYAGPHYMGGVSDHFPVYITIKY